MSKPTLQSVYKIGVYLLLISMLLSACASAASPSRDYDRANPASAPEYMAGGAAGEMENISYESIAESVPAQSKRLVIQNAKITLSVDDPGLSMDRIALLAQEMEGFVVTKNLYQQTLDSGLKVPRASITIRVPAERLNEALTKIKEESNQKPISESSDSQDVTSEYTDLQSRLRNLEKTEEQLNRIMEDAVSTEDVLSVYNQLVQIRDQIEVTKGRIQYYEQSAAMSAISIELLADEAIQPLSIGGWQPKGIAKDAVQQLINTLKFFVNALIWIVIYLLPVIVVLYVVFYLPLRFIWRKIRKPSLKRKKNPPQQQIDVSGE